MSPLKAWRLSKRKYARAAFSGEGASLTGGRWNSVGTPVVYASLSLSLAVLEVFVHMTNRPGPSDYVYSEADLPLDGQDAERIDVGKLPDTWKELETPALKEIGDEWAASQRSLVLIVPSVIIPREWNVILNPLHPDAKGIKLEEPEPFHFDQRLFK